MTSGLTKEHLSCPFCGDRDIRFRFDTGGGWVAECGSCPCELRWFSTEDEARAMWNRRPVEPKALLTQWEAAMGFVAQVDIASFAYPQGDRNRYTERGWQYWSSFPENRKSEP